MRERLCLLSPECSIQMIICRLVAANMIISRSGRTRRDGARHETKQEGGQDRTRGGGQTSALINVCVIIISSNVFS